MIKTRKLLAVLLAATLAGATFAGCGAKPADNTADDSKSTATDTKKEENKNDKKGGKVKLSYLSWQNETVMQPVLDAFYKENPNIEIDLQYAPPVQDYVEKFRMLAMSNELCDLFVTAAENKQDVLDNGYAMDLTDLPIWDHLPDANKNCYAKDGKYYAFAYNAWIAGYFYNKDIFKDNAIERPTSREELLAAGKKLKDKGVQPFGFCATNLYDPLQGYVATETIQKDSDYDKKVDAGELKYSDGWTEPVNLWYKDFVESGFMTEEMLGLDGDQAIDQFAMGDVAIMIGAPWNIPTLNEKNPDLDIGMLPFFGTEKDSTSMTGAVGVGWSANAATKHPDEAKKFIEFLASKTAIDLMQAKTGDLVSFDNLEYEISPVIEEGISYLKEGKFYLPAVNWKYSDALGKEILIGTQEVLSKTIEPQEIVKKMDAKWAELDAANK